jgi:hypothetical protein
MMQVRVTEEDIRGAIPSGLHNPVSRALERETGRKWFVWESGMAMEMQAPHRHLPLTAEINDLLLIYLSCGGMEPFEFEFELTDSHKT